MKQSKNDKRNTTATNLEGQDNKHAASSYHWAFYALYDFTIAMNERFSMLLLLL